MKKAIISTGGKQYVVAEGETLDIELLKGETSNYDFEALLVMDGDKVTVGTPTVPKVTVSAEIIAEDIQADKVTSIRYKAKKRVRTVRGHRQHHTTIRIVSIT